MNIIKLKVDFTNREIEKEGISLVEGDYNSTKIVFEFDKDYTERKIFEMAKPGEEESFFVAEIINDEVILVGEDENHNPASLFDEVGKYPFEITLYGTDSKLTSLNGNLSVKKEMVRIGDEEVTAYLPVFDQLMQDLNTATEAANNLDIEATKIGTTATITVTKKDGTIEEVEIHDGERGPQGETGPQGQQGPQGAIGPQGIQGPQGEQGLQGPKGDAGEQGEKGDKGDTALTVTVGTTTTGEAGTNASVQNVGTNQDLVLNFTIPRGAKGETGERGLQGETGPQGIQGLKGDTGERGPQGVQGPKGDTGERGLQGIQGLKGDTGEAGPQGQKGDTGEAGYTPVKGIDYFTQDDIDSLGIPTTQEKQGWSSKQEALVSGTNIKTIGGQSILGEGDLPVGGDCHVLGTFTNFTTSNRLNLNNLDVGTYLIMNKKSASTTDGIHFVGTYKETTSNLDKNKVDTIIGYASTLYMLNKITDDLSSNTVVAELIVNITSDSQLVAQQYYIRTKSTGLELTSGNNFQITSFIPLSANTTVFGKKTFSVLPESSVTPTTDNQLVNKKYVDDTVGNINTALEAIINGGVE